MTAPRRTSRLNFRVHDHTKQRLADVLEELQSRGLHATETEILETFLRIGLERPIDEIDAAIRNNRATAP